MQKYKYVDGYEGGWMEPAAHDSQAFYAASEVDARIAELEDALREAEEGLRTCYQVCDYPANGKSYQDDALRTVRSALKL